jgi:hypothetical protein
LEDCDFSIEKQALKIPGFGKTLDLKMPSIYDERSLLILLCTISRMIELTKLVENILASKI